MQSNIHPVWQSTDVINPGSGGKFTSYQSIILYRKFKADQIFTGHALVSEDQVLITDKAGVVMDIIHVADAGGDIEVFNGILSPGFINCHCHLELSHLKGMIPRQSGLVEFVFKIVTERHFDDELIGESIERAEQEMIRNGIVAVGDICNNKLTIRQKIKGNLHYHNFIEASGFPPQVAEIRFQRSLDFLHTYRQTFSSNSLVPHAPYSVSPEMFNMIDRLPGNQVLSIHNQETAAENEFFKTGTGELLKMYEKMNIDISFFKPTGKSSLQSCLPFFTNGQSIILVHNVATSKEDIEFANLKIQHSNLKLFYCLCPHANLYISNKLPDPGILNVDDGSMVLGTDSLASNDQLSILEEIRVFLQYFPTLSLSTALQWATLNGARALGIEHTFGSFDKGKKPGIVLIDPEFTRARRIG